MTELEKMPCELRSHSRPEIEKMSEDNLLSPSGPVADPETSLGRSRDLGRDEHRRAQFSESGGSLNGPKPFTELPFL